MSAELTQAGAQFARSQKSRSRQESRRQRTADRSGVKQLQLEQRQPDEPAAAPESDAVALMAVISRAASDPATDADKLERLLGMYERVMSRDASAAYTASLADMQAELPVIAERGEIKVRDQVQSRYALWEDINETIKPILTKNGFALSFRTGNEGDKIMVTGFLSHRKGHREETRMLLPLDMSGDKNAVQRVGSSTSYGKRYTAAALLNLTSRGEDDDGVMAGARRITEAQRDALNILADSVGADKRKLCEFFGIDAIAALPARDYRRAIEMLKAKGCKS